MSPLRNRRRQAIRPAPPPGSGSSAHRPCGEGIRVRRGTAGILRAGRAWRQGPVRRWPFSGRRARRSRRRLPKCPGGEKGGTGRPAPAVLSAARRSGRTGERSASPGARGPPVGLLRVRGPAGAREARAGRAPRTARQRRGEVVGAGGRGRWARGAPFGRARPAVERVRHAGKAARWVVPPDPLLPEAGPVADRRAARARPGDPAS